MQASAQSRLRWAVRHYYVIMVLVGLVMLALIYPVGGYLAERNQELLAKLCIDEACSDDPNFMYLHDGGDGFVVTVMLFLFGGGLLYVAATTVSANQA